MTDRSEREKLSESFEAMRLENEIPDEAFIGDGYGPHTCIIDWTLEHIRPLKKKLEVAKEALTFYADSYTWVSNSGKVGCNPIDYDWLNIPGTSGAPRMCGGNKARAALAAIEEK